MNIEDIVAACKYGVATNGYITIADEVLRTLTADDVQTIQRECGSGLLKLPEYEVVFFEWLRSADSAVWDDLWADETQAPYLVSLSHLHRFIGERPGVFAICDLRNTDNFYFAPEMILIKESTAFLGAVRELFLRNERLTPAQLLALEASNGPVDIWHLAYRTNTSVEVFKKAVRQLVEDNVLVHVPDADHLATIFDVQ